MPGKDSSFQKPIIAAAVVAGIGVAGFAGYKYYQHKKGSGDKKASTSIKQSEHTTKSTDPQPTIPATGLRPGAVSPVTKPQPSASATVKPVNQPSTTVLNKPISQPTVVAPVKKPDMPATLKPGTTTVSAAASQVGVGGTTPQAKTSPINIIPKPSENRVSPPKAGSPPKAVGSSNLVGAAAAAAAGKPPASMIGSLQEKNDNDVVVVSRNPNAPASATAPPSQPK